MKFEHDKTMTIYIYIYINMSTSIPKKGTLLKLSFGQSTTFTRIAFTICSKLNGWIASLNRDVSDGFFEEKNRPTYGHPKIAINEMKELVRFQALKL